MRLKGPSIGNCLWGVKWCHVTPKGQVVTPMRLESNIAKTARDDKI